VSGKQPTHGLIDARQLAAYLGVSVQSIYCRVSRKELPLYKLGRLTRFKADEIDAWLATKHVEPVAPLDI